MDIADLTAAVAAAAPVYGVTIGNPADKTTWTIQFQPGATVAQKAAAQAVLTGWVDPPPAMTFLNFLALFTSAEQMAFVSSTDVQMKLWITEAAGSGMISFADARLKAALDYAVSLGLLTSARESQILAGQPHP